MLAKYWMEKNVVTVDANDSMDTAVSLLRKHPQALLPVLKDGWLIGVITDRDIKRASASDATSLEIHELIYLVSRIKAQDIMSKNPVTVPPDFTLEEAADLFLSKGISGAPVVDDAGAILGVISQKEIYRALVSLSGLERRGIQAAFSLEDRPGSIKEVTDIVRGYGGRIASILSSSELSPEGRRQVYVRAYDIDRETMDRMVEDLRAAAQLLYLVDHRENRRQEFLPRQRVA